MYRNGKAGNGICKICNEMVTIYLTQGFGFTMHSNISFSGYFMIGYYEKRSYRTQTQATK